MIVNRQAAQESWDLIRGHMSRNAYQDHDIPVGGSVDLATEELVNKAYRQASRMVHPDAGGDAETFARVDRAKHVLLGWLARQPETVDAALGGLCTDCNGTGHVKMQRAWGPALRKQCPRCRGTGDTNYEHEKGTD